MSIDRLKCSFSIEDFKNNRISKGNLRFLYVNITNKCNLRCLYCYDDDSKNFMGSKDLELDVYKKLAKDCKKLGLHTVALTGGELFLNKNWFEIASFFKEEGIALSGSSNGTLITEEIINKLKSLNFAIQISLDGDEEIMNFVTRKKNTYDRILNTLDSLKENNIYFSLNCVVGKHNLHIIEFMNEISLKYNVYTRFALYNNIFNNSKEILKRLTIEDIDQLIYKLNNLCKINKKLVLGVPPLLIPEEMEVKVNPGCGWGYYVGGVLYNGDVTVCALASGVNNYVAGNIVEESFESIWNNSQLFKKLRSYSHNDLQGICSLCPVNSLCLGSCRLDSFLRSGSAVGPSYMCQEYYEALLDGRIKRDYFPSKILQLV